MFYIYIMEQVYPLKTYRIIWALAPREKSVYPTHQTNENERFHFFSLFQFNDERLQVYRTTFVDDSSSYHLTINFHNLQFLRSMSFIRSFLQLIIYFRYIFIILGGNNIRDSCMPDGIYSKN